MTIFRFNAAARPVYGSERECSVAAGMRVERGVARCGGCGDERMCRSSNNAQGQAP